ncbi:MAG TPA: uracil-DNA glycosylase family protein [Flavobacterium sp.]|nr:uracil-DNA glycosylase family protein [Flavobacterium sp.]HRA73660.1 uracil-DNA glycosylase family protein [Flavobacterium sp.]
MNYRIGISIDGKNVETLSDILPKDKELKILFIAKTPATLSVKVGHYFQGQQGTMFWNMLKKSGILKVKPNTYDDENLLDNKFGITDIVKVPRDYGNEPSIEEYKEGLIKINEIINKFHSKILVFVYKGVLDNILKHQFNIKQKSDYGFNPHLDKLFGSIVFVFPMPGTPCKKENADLYMKELKKIV